MDAHVTLIVDGVAEGNRSSWPAIPTQGHYVELGAGAGKTKLCLVTKVVWRRTNVPDLCQIDIHCKGEKK